MVCRGMGLQYLWIDALCITQDDPNDKSVETAKMISIYGSATVTIMAARSSLATERILGKDFLALEKAPFVRIAALIVKLVLSLS